MSLHVDHHHCSSEDECRLYRPGHILHAIQVRIIGQEPWGWRDGLICGLENQYICIRYLEEDVAFTAWHHRDLSSVLTDGMPVRVSQQAGSVLAGPFGMVCIASDSPLSCVPEPEHPELWSAEFRPAVVDLSTGNAIEVFD